MTGRLAGKAAVVTGAGQGIGAEVAAALAAEGAAVAVADIDADRAGAVAERIRSTGASSVGLAVDIADEQSVRQLVSNVLAALGRLDVLCNNAGLTDPDHLARDGDVTSMDMATWTRTLAVNLTGTMLCCKHALGPMAAAGGGSIINTSSGASLAGDEVLTAYGVSKAGVNLLTRSVAAQYGRAGVRANAICPGPTITQTSPPAQAAFMQSAYERVLPTPYLGRGTDMAAATVFLASDESRYITGQVISIDGGLFAHQPTVCYPPFPDRPAATRGER